MNQLGLIQTTDLTKTPAYSGHPHKIENENAMAILSIDIETQRRGPTKVGLRLHRSPGF